MLRTWIPSHRRLKVILVVIVVLLLIPLFFPFSGSEDVTLFISDHTEKLEVDVQHVSGSEKLEVDVQHVSASEKLEVDVQHVSGREKLEVDVQHVSGSKSPTKKACVHPKLMSRHPAFMGFFSDATPLRCSGFDDNWVYTLNGTFRISDRAVRKHGNITCTYIPIYRPASDDYIVVGTPVASMRNKDTLISEVFQTKCVADDGANRTDFHVGITPNDRTLRRGIRGRRRMRGSKDTVKRNPLDLDILMFGYDSVSRLTWIRSLPKTYKYMVDVLGVTVLDDYNIVGDGTPAALLPILTGKSQGELPEARKGFPGSKVVDGHPWIWRDLKNVGYATQWGEQSPYMGTFTLRMLGFEEQPVDHYMRTFYLAAEWSFRQYFPECFGSITRHQHMLNWMKEFLTVYGNQRKFSFVFHSEYTHRWDSYGSLRHADEELQRFLEYLHSNGHLDKAMLVLMSDHGNRNDDLRATEQGKYEERLPFFSVRLPPWFHEKYPDAVNNLKTNAHRLVTPFDIHETFHDIIDFKGSGRGDLTQRGISLFKEIPLERTCADAGIDTHWCACLSWTDAKLDDERVRGAALAIVQKINSLTELERSNCEKLQLAVITKALKGDSNDAVLRFHATNETAAVRYPIFSDRMNSSAVLYQITLQTEPGNALYEATVKFDIARQKYRIHRNDISRINRYGHQPHCIIERLPHLRPYCLCRISPPTR